jgi:epoxyqueuosine reductase
MNALQHSLVETIVRFTAESPANRLADIDGSPIFDAPLVGFAAGDAPLFEQFRTVVGDFHLTPGRVLDLENGAEAGVVAWILPIARATRRSNRAMAEGCSLRWNHTRFAGEAFNDCLRRHVVQFLTAHGCRAVAPALTDQFRQVTLANGPASTWSERHIAYAAGLGTFSLSDGLITARGIAHRVGSVVCAARFEPTPRPYADYRDYCRHDREGSCGECIRRCPAGAISAAGHDKHKCRAYVMETLRPWAQKSGYMGETYVGCGLCQVGVPCEKRIPVR